MLYILLSLEAFSLLIGSLLLFVALAGVMYGTRRIDWSAPRQRAALSRLLGAGGGSAKPLPHMTDPSTAEAHFPDVRSRRASRAAMCRRSPQTESAAYKLAFQDTDFLLREDLRPVRFQLELLKPELLMNEAKIGSTFVFYGSARIPEPAKADALLAAATDDRQRADRRAAERQVALL